MTGVHTLLTVRLDFPAGWMAVHVGGGFFIILLLVFIILLEAYILYLLGCGPWRRALGLSLAMNLASSLLGFVAGLVAPINPVAERPDHYAGVMEIIDWYRAAPGPIPTLPAISLFLLLSLVLSIWSEGLVLRRLTRHAIPGRRIWLVSFIANGASYLLWFSLFVWWLEVLEPLLGYSMLAAFFVSFVIFNFGPWLGAGLVLWGFWRLVKRLITGQPRAMGGGRRDG